jgi:hypothetical protein
MRSCIRRLPFVLALLRVVPSWAAITEEERIEGFHARNYSWPPSKYVPDTPGWRALKAQRFTQISHLTNAEDRYQAYAMMVRSAFLISNFTELGFGLARAPKEMTAELQEVVLDELPSAREREPLSGFLGPSPFEIKRPLLTQRILHELKPYAEAWSRTRLVDPCH